MLFWRLIFSVVFVFGISLSSFAFNQSDSVTCGGSDLDNIAEGSVELEAVWYPDCAAGEYVPLGGTQCVTCLADNYCTGGTLYEEGPASAAFGITGCGGLKSPSGSHSVNDCGHILHIGDSSTLFLHADRQTTPSLVVDIDGTQFFADTTPVSEGIKTISAGDTKTLRLLYQGQEYTVHSRIYE